MCWIGSERPVLAALGYTMARSEPRCFFCCFLWCAGSNWHGDDGCPGSNPSESFQEGLESLNRQLKELANKSRRWKHLRLFCSDPVLYFENATASAKPIPPERDCRELQYRISNKEFRTAEVCEKNKQMFFTSIFCGSLFCGSAVHILKDLIADGLMQNADLRDLIMRFCSTPGLGFFTSGWFNPG